MTAAILVLVTLAAAASTARTIKLRRERAAYLKALRLRVMTRFMVAQSRGIAPCIEDPAGGYHYV